MRRGIPSRTSMCRAVPHFISSRWRIRRRTSLLTTKSAKASSSSYRGVLPDRASHQNHVIGESRVHSALLLTGTEVSIPGVGNPAPRGDRTRSLPGKLPAAPGHPGLRRLRIAPNRQTTGVRNGYLRAARERKPRKPGAGQVNGGRGWPLCRGDRWQRSPRLGLRGRNSPLRVNLGAARWGVGSNALLELGEIGFLRFPDAGIGSKTNTNEEQELALATTV
jgi:hypothetical protein